jgi:hypothetical protein
MANDRIFYATQGLGFAPNGQTEVGDATRASGFIEAHGVQSVAIDTTFNLEQVFELGQIDIYENIEGLPDIELTAQKVLDGYPLLYHLATQGATSSSLNARSKQRAFVALNIYSDVFDSASGTPETQVEMSGMFVSSLTYTLNVDGNSTEDVTLVGNNKKWRTSSFTFLPNFTNTDAPLAITGSGGVQRREDVLMSEDAFGSRWPTDIPGITASGTNVLAGDAFGAHLQTVTISVDLGLEELNELGQRNPYARPATFPVEITTAIDVTSSDGDRVDALADPPGGTNLTDQEIIIKMREGLVVNLGTKNKLASVSYGGGDAGGGNVTQTFNYSNFNILTATHPQDPASL